MGNLIGTLFVGLIVGAIARLVTPGDQKLGWILTSLLGVAGSFVASFVGQAAHWYQAGPAGRVDRLGDRRRGAAVRGGQAARRLQRPGLSAPRHGRPCRAAPCRPKK